MSDMIPARLARLAEDGMIAAPVVFVPERLFSIWEITTWILPMAPEHFRRVLAASPYLPQGSAGAEGGTRWFTTADLARLRAHFAGGARGARYRPARPPKAPLVVLAGPMGAMGRTSSLLHLAVAGALCGYRILVIAGDPAGSSGLTLPAPSDHGDVQAARQGVLSLMARSAAEHLLRLNEARLDRGDSPQPLAEDLTAALTLAPADLIRPTLWPGLEVMDLSSAAMLGDMRIAGWRQALRTWAPGRALAQALDRSGLRARYDLILCDTPRGLGPLALALLGSADILLAPLPLQDGALARFGPGLQALAQAATLTQDEAQQTARALGQSAPPLAWSQFWVLPIRAGADAGRQMAGFAAKLGPTLLPAPLPEVEAVARGQLAHLYDLDYRSVGRLSYAPLREAADAAWRGLAEALFARQPGFAAKL